MPTRRQAGILRPGNAGANTASDHITVLDQALAQIPDEHRRGQPILVRADGAGATKAWLAHLRSLRARSLAWTGLSRTWVWMETGRPLGRRAAAALTSSWGVVSSQALRFE